MIEARTEEIAGFFAGDHRRIDLALGTFHLEAEPSRALWALEVFESMLLRHIRWEDCVLFPAFEEKLGAEAIPCASSMRLQHEALKQRLAELRQAVGREGFERRNVEETLVEALSDHNHAEEDFIYPWMDAVFTRDERLRLLRSLDR